MSPMVLPHSRPIDVLGPLLAVVAAITFPCSPCAAQASSSDFFPRGFAQSVLAGNTRDGFFPRNYVNAIFQGQFRDAVKEQPSRPLAAEKTAAREPAAKAADEWRAEWGTAEPQELLHAAIAPPKEITDEWKSR